MCPIDKRGAPAKDGWEKKYKMPQKLRAIAHLMPRKKVRAVSGNIFAAYINKTILVKIKTAPANPIVYSKPRL